MPVAPAIIAAIISAAAAVGTTAFEIADRPGTPKVPGIPKPTAQQVGVNRAEIGQQLPTLQSQVGGSVSPEYFRQIATQLSGAQNQPGSGTAAQEAISQFFGGGGGPGAGAGAPSLTGRGGGGSGLSDSLLQQLHENIVGGQSA